MVSINRYRTLCIDQVLYIGRAARYENRAGRRISNGHTFPQNGISAKKAKHKGKTYHYCLQFVSRNDADVHEQ
jgi:hypothetical protein